MSPSARILVVDDDRTLCDALEDVLRAQGHTVETSTRGREGIERLRARPFDIAIVDIGLPDVSGLDLLEAIKTVSPETEVIFITGHASIDTALQAIHGSAFAYVVKPLGMNHLLAILDKALEKQALARALRESEERYRLITENIKDAVFLLDLEDRVVLMNQRGEELTGYQADELRGRRIHDLLHPGGDEPSRDPGEMTGTGAAPLAGEIQIRRRDAQRIWAEFSITSVVRGESVIARLAVAHDITERKRAVEVADALFQVGRELATTLQFGPVTDRIVSSVLELFQVRRVALYQVEPATGVLTCVAAAGRDPMSWVGRTLPPNTGVAGRALAEGRPVWAADVLADPGITLPEWLVERFRIEGFRAALGIPLISARETVGALVLADVPGRVYTDRDLRLLTAFADQAGVALRNARLFGESERRREAAERLADVGRVLSRSLDPQQVAQHIADSVRALLGTQYAALYESEPQSRDLAQLAVSGDLGHAIGHIPCGVGVVGAAAREGRRVMTLDVLADPRITLPPEFRARIEEAPYRAVVAVPLIAHERVVGVCSVGDRAGRVFSDAELALLETFADQAALALVNAQLYRAAQRRVTDLTRVQNVIAAVSTTLRPDELARALVREIGQAWGYPLVALYLREGDGLALQAAAGGQAAMPFIRLDQGLSGRAARTGQPVFVRDAARAPDFICGAPGARQAIVVPLKTGDGQVQGTLLVQSRGEPELTTDDVTLLTLLADRASVTLTNARLFTEANRRRWEAEQLAEVGRLVSQSLDLGEVAQQIVASVMGLLRAQHASLYRLEPESGDLSLLALAGDASPVIGPGFVMPRDTGIVGLAVREGRPVVTANVLADPRITLRAELHARVEQAPYRAAVAVPLLVQGRVVGVCSAGDRAGRVFSGDDLALLGALAGQAALALDNARLYEATRDAGDFLRSVAENSADGIVTADLRGRVTYFSPGAEEMSGYRAEEILGQPASDYWGGGREAARVLMKRLGAEGRIPDYENAFRARDGRWIETSTSLSLLRDARGAIIGTMGVVRDVTGRKLGEDALRASETRYRTVVEGSIQGLLIRGDTAIEFANRALAEMFGYESPDDLIGQPYSILIAPGERARLDEYRIARARSDPAPTRYEFQGVRKDGTPIWTELLASVVPWKGETAVMGTVIDITERRRAEEERARLSSAVEQAAESVMITERDGTIVYVNPAFERITGYAQREILGQTPRLLKSGQQDPAFYARLWQALLAGQVWHGEVVNRRKDGSLFTEEQSIAPVRDAQGLIHYFVAIGQDITPRRGLEDQLRQAQKMEAVGRLAGGVAHDFNNLLAVIMGYSEVMLKMLHEQDPLREDAEEIWSAAQRASALTQQLLVFSRKQTLQPRVLDLCALVAGMERMLCRLLGEDVLLVTRFEAEESWVHADPGQLEQVVLNLAVNARDAMPRGGELTIETANVELDEAFGRRDPGTPPGPYVRLAVSDTGAGMDGETQAHLFEPFFTTKESGQGTGLGLAMVYGIVKQHQGAIVVESEPGRGTRFEVYLPHLKDAGGVTATPSEPSRTRGGRETILVVEDDASVRRLVADTLAANGYTVLEAANGAEALQIAARLEGPLHLLLTDVIMPRMSGRELADHLTAGNRSLRILYMSGYTDDALGRRGVLDPGTVLLPKPFSLGALTRKVREVLDADTSPP